MKRILFVDDEPNVLEGLQNLLRKFRKEWEMSFVCGGEEAVRRLETEHFDDVVADMRMPVIDGAALLRQVQERHPSTVRIVLSGQTEEEVARRVVFIAHQFLAKPCDPNQLKETIERACALNELLGEERLQIMVGKIGQLPAMRSVFASLVRTLEDAKSSLKDVAAVVQQDPAISAKTLQVVNSAFFGLARRMSDVEQAVCYLGIEVIKGLALMIEVFQGAAAEGGAPRFDLEAEQGHALLTARIARRLIAEKGPPAQDAFTAGMLHDCGRVIIATRLPEMFGRVEEGVRKTRRPAYIVEEEVLGASHAEIGAYLLGLWGLPFSIVEAVARHDAPSRVAQSSFDALGAVHVADHLVHEQLPGDRTNDPLDTAYLDSLGVGGKLDEWRTIAAEESGALARA